MWFMQTTFNKLLTKGKTKRCIVNKKGNLLTMSRKKRCPTESLTWKQKRNIDMKLPIQREKDDWRADIGTQRDTRRHEPAAIRSFSHVQTFSFQMRRARCILTRWCGVNFDCSPSHVAFHFDFRTIGVGSRCHLVHDARSDASFCCHLVLSFVVSALATMTRRKYISAVSASLRFETLPPL